jgi:hypothetical protein
MESIGNTSTMEPTYNETGIPLSPRPVQTPLYGPPTTSNEYTASTATIAPSKIDSLVWAVMILAALILLLAILALKKPR